MQRRLPFPHTRRRAPAAVLLLAGILCAAGCTGLTPEVYTVEQVRLNVRQGPSLSAPVIFVLDGGARVFFRGERREADGYRWLRVFFLYRVEYEHVDRRMEGWIAEAPAQGAGGRLYASRVGNPITRLVATRGLLKWRLRAAASERTRNSTLLSRIRFLFPYESDKLLHVLAMFLLTLAVFLLLLVALRRNPLHAFLGSVLIANALGLSNEVLDLLTGSGAFERADMVANALGSAGVIVPCVLVWGLRRRRRGERRRDDA